MLTGVCRFSLSPKTMEVAIARVYNWDVVQKRKDKSEEEEEEEAKKGKLKGAEGEGPPNG